MADFFMHKKHSHALDGKKYKSKLIEQRKQM
nr:MAG TPA: hypothetical protein [Caudoviricetes sp.]